MARIDKFSRISDLLPPDEVLAQMAEELTEMAQACLKLRRALTGINPTPITVGECRRNLLEEYADVLVCKQVFNEYEDDFFHGAEDIAARKYERWLKRLEKYDG